MRRKKRGNEEFLDEIEVVRYRDKRGRYSARPTARREVVRKLLVVDRGSGSIKEYGEIRVSQKHELKRFRMIDDNLSVKDELAVDKIYSKLQRKKAKGVIVTIRGTGKKGKDAVIKSRIIFKKGKKGKKYLENLIVGKVMKKLKDRKFRLSSKGFKKNKRFAHLKNQTFKIEYYD